jgi:hypothetical protein
LNFPQFKEFSVFDVTSAGVPNQILVALFPKLSLYGFWPVGGRFPELLRILEKEHATRLAGATGAANGFGGRWAIPVRPHPQPALRMGSSRWHGHGKAGSYLQRGGGVAVFSFACWAW